MSDSASDEILMAAYQAGNPEAFRELFDRYAASVYGFLVRRVGDPAQAEDLYQEVFLRVHRARATYDAGRPFRAWLFAIVHNLLKDTHRARQRRADAEGRRADVEAADRLAERSTWGDGSGLPTPEEALAARESGLALSQALQALPTDEATVLLLARVEGLPYEDIGPIIGRSPAATKQLAYRALKRVRAELATAGHLEES